MQSPIYHRPLQKPRLDAHFDKSGKDLILEELLRGPYELGISFELWNKLADRYLRYPNLYTPSIAQASNEGQFGISEDEIMVWLAFYWALAVTSWRFESIFTQECFNARFPTYTRYEPLQEVPRFGIRYEVPTPLGDDLGEYFCFTPTLPNPDRYLDNPYTAEDFRVNHSLWNPITLRGCQGISTRLVSKSLSGVHQVQYIAEYAAACEACQTLNPEPVPQPFFARSLPCSQYDRVAEMMILDHRAAIARAHEMARGHNFARLNHLQ